MYVLAGIASQPASVTAERVLVLDNNVVSCNVVAAMLREAGFQADTCAEGTEALDILAKRHHRVLVADQHRGPIDNLAVVREVQQQQGAVSVILLTGDDSLDSAVAALKSGVFDFMTKSFDLSSLAEHLLDAVHRAFDTGLRSGGEQRPRLPAPRDPTREVLVGDCREIERARHAVRIAMSNEAPLLIIGEVGTEKASVARAIHAASPRQKEPFEAVDTSQLGASTDLLAAVRTWSDARRGTLFFPEISSLSSVWQVELVRLLSALDLHPESPRPRIIAGLSQPAAETWEGSMLMRSFQRLGGGEVTLPPLRERGRDVLILAEHFAEQNRLARGDASLRITPTAVEALMRYAWPGNVDELRFGIQHAASLCVDSVIRVVDLPPSIGLSLKGATDESGTRLEVQSLEDMELSYILRVLDAVGGNKASAARLLGVDRTTLYRKLQRQEQGESVAPSSAPSSEVAPVRGARR
jgi:DNA-binding NtrC family response regulator